MRAGGKKPTVPNPAGGSRDRANLVPRTFYRMPAYARDGKVICFFQAKAKFKVRYSTLCFQPDARLDETEMWPVAFALTSLTAAGEKRIAELVKQTAGRGCPDGPTSSLAVSCAADASCCHPQGRACKRPRAAVVGRAARIRPHRARRA